MIAHGSAWGLSTSRTLVRFDGRGFALVEKTPTANVCADVKRVTGRRDRLIGRLIEAGILPMTVRLIPKAVAQATPIANRYLQGFVEETADKIITTLNHKTPIEKTVHLLLFPKTTD